MNIDISSLKSGISEYIDIDLIYSFTKEQLENTEIISLDDVIIKGDISYNYNRYDISLDIKGVLALPCSLSLKPVNVPFETHVEGDLEEILEETSQKLTNTLDIFPIIWENILMEIPLKVVSEDNNFKTSGDGWRLITEDEPKVNLELEKLKDLL